MNQLFVSCAGILFLALGCGPTHLPARQILPSPDGSYQAVVLDCGTGPEGGWSLLKVTSTGGPLNCGSKALQEATLPSEPQPRLAWLSHDTLLVDERGTPPRPSRQGQVSLVFSPWDAAVSAPGSKGLACRNAPSAAAALAAPMTLGLVNEITMSDPPVVLRGALSRGVQDRLGKAPPVESVCSIPGLKLPADFAVLVGGAFGGKESEARIDDSGLNATTIEVTVDQPQKPVVLMLGAYQPTLWTIRPSKATRILAVLASGQHRQAVLGLDGSVPVALHTNENASPCGYFHVDMRHLEDLNAFARQFFGHEIDKVYPAAEGKITMGQSPTQTTPWVGRGDAPVESYLTGKGTSQPFAQEAINEAVRKKVLRRANLLDKLEWENAMVRLVRRQARTRAIREEPTGPIDSKLQYHDTYVVLKPMDLPPPRDGGSPVAFLVPKGVQHPRGDPYTYLIYDFNDMSCFGPVCPSLSGGLSGWHR